MHLKSVQITNYRSIIDSNQFSIGKITALVGKNESGKTAILQALEKLNPMVEENEKFDQLEEFPRGKYNDFDDKTRPNDVVEATWELNSSEIEKINAIFGVPVLSSYIIKTKKGYNNKLEWIINVLQEDAIKAIVSESDLHEEEKIDLQSSKTVQILKDVLEKISQPSERQTKLLQRVKNAIPEGNLTAQIESILEEHLPSFLYFGNYDLMKGQVAVEDIVARQAQKTLKNQDRVFLALLRAAKTSLLDLQSLTQFEALTARLEGISNKLTKEIFQYWSQNKYLKIKFDFRPALSQDPPPFNIGFIFRTRIENTRHQVTVGFDERSTGFVWFFSFLVWFSQIKGEHEGSLILLLDEPGLNLHAKAQADLLKYFLEKLAPDHQVIYTTHSPFMIDPSALESIRTVEDVVKNDDLLGTKVSEDILSTDRDTLFPLQAALGYEITQTLFIGKDTLLVKGPSEIMALQWVSQELRKAKRESLDPRWVIAPAGGIDKVSSFVSLFGGNKLHIAVLTDLANGDKGKIQRLKENALLKTNHIFTAADITGQAEADLEDILGRDLYIKLVNECYKLKGKNALSVTKSTSTPIRVVKEVEEHFKTLLPPVPEFDHFTPCAYLLTNADSLRSILPGYDEALDRFEALFKNLNSLL
jgi:predicted ATP-dependent endonuclease of OLD family